MQTSPTVELAKASMSAMRDGAAIKATVRLDLAEGFHAYAPGAEDGLPLTLSVGEGFEAIEGFQIDSTDEHLVGGICITFATRGAAAELVASLRVQLCDDFTCLAPQTLELRCHVQTAG